jgi:hypothetical protein
METASFIILHLINCLNNANIIVKQMRNWILENVMAFAFGTAAHVMSFIHSDGFKNDFFYFKLIF